MRICLKSSYVYCRLARLTGAFKITLTQYCVLSDLIRRMSNYMCQILFICKGPTSFRKYKPVNMRIYVTVKITQKERLLIWNSDITQNLKIYLYDCRIERAIFLAAKHEKTIMGCSYLVFYKYFLHFENLASNTIKDESINLNSWHHSHKKQKNSLETQVVNFIILLELQMSGVAIQRIYTSEEEKIAAFVRNRLVKIILRLFQPISVVTAIVSTLLRQFKRLAQGHWSCTPTH